MANAKPKPEEPAKRSPGKSKFVFPKREAPPVDNTYFDRLFSELQEQSQASEATPPVAEVPSSNELTPDQAAERQTDQPAPNITPDTFFPAVELPKATPRHTKTSKIKRLSADKPIIQDPINDSHSVGSVEVTPLIFCKPETSSYVDRLKLKYRLSKGEANVFKILLGETHDKGISECYINVPKLAEAARLSTRGCQLTLKNLQMREFISRVEEYDHLSKLGIKIQINLIPL